MKYIAIKNGKGPLENLFISDSEKPTTKSHELLVKVNAFGINRMDLLQREGKYPVPPQAQHLPMGVEFAGVIEELGDSTTGFEKGDRVFGLAYGGAYAEYIVNPATMCLKIPEQLDDTQAAGILEVWITAIQALHHIAHITRGDNVLIHAGASGVGLAAIQLASNLGCRVYSTAGSESKNKLCEKYGSVKSINYKTSDFEKVIKEHQEGLPESERGIDVIVDFIGANYWSRNIALCRLDARIVYLACLSGSKTEVDLAQILYKRLQITGSTLRSRSAEYQGELLDKFRKLALHELQSGKFVSHIDKVFPWQEIQAAQGRMERNEGDGGKIICTIT